ncbi:MAG: hypothetical protein ACK44H_10190, partial [Candidatus Kryptonium sp.]
EIPSRFSFSGVFEYDDSELKWDYIKICADYLRCSKDKLFAKFTWGRIKKMIKQDKEIKIKSDAVDSLLLFARVIGDEEWINRLSELKKDLANGGSLRAGDPGVDVFNVNSGASIGGFIGEILSKYCVFDVDSFDKRIYLSLFVKDGWDFFEIRNLRIQNMRINVFMKTMDNCVDLSFEKKNIPEVKVIFEPRFEKKITIEKVWLDDKPTQDFEFDGEKVKLEFSFRFKKEIKIFFD